MIWVFHHLEFIVVYKSSYELFLYKNIYFIENNNGDIMIFVYIENYSFLTKVINYLKYSDISYTADPNIFYSSILIAEINNKTIKLMEDNPDKNFIFITYLEESKIFHHFNSNNKRSRTFRNKYHIFFRKCHKLIVSLPYYKNILKSDCSDIVIIPQELPIINISRSTKDIYQKYSLNKRKKKIIVIDLHYKNLDYLYNLAIRYSKFEFIYIGYESNYLLTKKYNSILYKLPSNIICFPYIDINIFSDLCKVSYMVIDFDSYLFGSDYIYMSLLFKKYFLLFDNRLYKDLLIPSKHCYYFDSKEELFLRIDKIISDRVMNLSEIGYDLIKNFTFNYIVKKYREYLQ